MGIELIVIAVLVGGMFFLTSRSTRKRQAQANSFRDSLAPGQEVMTGSGYFGTIVKVEDDVITLESTPGTQSRWLRAAISKVVEPPVDAADEDDTEDSLETSASEDLDGSRAFTIPEDISSLLDKPKTEDEK